MHPDEQVPRGRSKVWRFCKKSTLRKDRPDIPETSWLTIQTGENRIEEIQRASGVSQRSRF